MGDIAHETETFADLTIPEQTADLDVRLNDLLGRVVVLEERIVEEVRKVLEDALGAEIAKRLEPELERLTGLVTAAVSKAEHGGAIVDAFAHAKIGALLSAVQRAIGITVDMPDYAGAATADPKVEGAETASQLDSGKS